MRITRHADFDLERVREEALRTARFYAPRPVTTTWSKTDPKPDPRNADRGVRRTLMATGFASALSEGQPAQLDLGEEACPASSSVSPAPTSMLAPQRPDLRPTRSARPA